MLGFIRKCLSRPPALSCALCGLLVLAGGGRGLAQGRAPVRDPQRFIREYVCSYKELQQRQIVMQQYDYSCGAATLATIARYYWGDEVDEEYFLDLVPKLRLTQKQLEDRVKNGLTLTDLRNLANKAGYDAEMLEVDFDELAKAKLPVIVGIVVSKHEHFAVFRGTDYEWAYLADPIRGNVRTPLPDFVRQWQRNAILVIAQRGQQVKPRNPMGIRAGEINRGALNYQTIRRNALMPYIQYPVPVAPR